MANNPGHEILAPSRNELDVSRRDDIERAVDGVRPDVIINCAAFHNLLACEEEPARAFMVNAVAVRDLAMACAQRSVRLVTFSTDYVFDGSRTEAWREDDKPAPLQIYGVTRLAGENAALANAPGHAIVIRTCGLYGRAGSRSRGGNFVDARVADARANSEIDVSHDQTVTPTSTNDLSFAVYALIEHPDCLPGIYHLTNDGQCTWCEFTKEIVRLIGAKCEVRPVNRGGRTGLMRRPLYSVLANTRARALGIVMRPWQLALADYIRAKYPRRSEH